ncbi:hypothetical protein OWM54_17930 [Myxococcus sp. MISCRS1]|uniref:hypothetical protein n=1 Tax=Myxococcus TaxID=32 RepID=UPI001CBBA9CE|nr:MULTISPECIES: hypothetical protein [unclassified Myxococcus]MCY0999022.1 hypothetical protein [Myxococcus sp. MISCRS1]BDT30974.1 hypothetical protein MFMH1_06430 [Myxococcus sp. MH1]
MRRFLSCCGLVVLVLLFAPGCPLDIRVRCDESHACASNEVCVRGGCEPRAVERVGEDCDGDSECGPGLTCGLGFPGGYCLLECSADAPCPSGTVCAKDLGVCLLGCGEDCYRPGYGCGPVPDSSGLLNACVPVATQADGGGSDGGGGADGGGGLDAGCTTAVCEAPDAGCSGPTCGSSDGGCAATVGMGGACTRACECLEAAAACVEGRCAETCTSDFTCRDGRRCNNDECEVGPRLGEACKDPFDCADTARCRPERPRCEESCNPNAGGGICPAGYQCALDGLCVRECTGIPESTGEVCENSWDCATCAVCLSSGAESRCRRTCRLDRDCPGGAVGACEQVGETKACRL